MSCTAQVVGTPNQNVVNGTCIQHALRHSRWPPCCARALAWRSAPQLAEQPVHLHRVGACRHNLHALCNHGCRQNGGSGGAVACQIVCACSRLRHGKVHSSLTWVRPYGNVLAEPHASPLAARDNQASSWHLSAGVHQAPQTWCAPPVAQIPAGPAWRQCSQQGPPAPLHVPQSHHRSQSWASRTWTRAQHSAPWAPESHPPHWPTCPHLPAQCASNRQQRLV